MWVDRSCPVEVGKPSRPLDHPATDEAQHALRSSAPVAQSDVTIYIGGFSERRSRLPGTKRMSDVFSGWGMTEDGTPRSAVRAILCHQQPYC